MRHRNSYAKVTAHEAFSDYNTDEEFVVGRMALYCRES